MIRRLTIAAAALAAATAPAFAHLNPAEHGSFAAGFSHPLFGLDHVLVMIAVGLWAASKGSKAMLIVPAAFVSTMALGFMAAIFAMPLPFVEPVILASVIFLGLMVALALPFSTAAMAVTVGFFALFHGFAHGSELAGAGAGAFATGFVLATALLHATGVALAVAFARFSQTRALTRTVGLATAAAGLALVFAN